MPTESSNDLRRTISRISAMSLAVFFSLVIVWYLLVDFFGIYGEFLAILIVVIVLIFFILWLLNLSYSHGYSTPLNFYEGHNKK